MARIAIIGAATGIGSECVTQLKARGDEVVAFDLAEVDWADRWIELDLGQPDIASAIARRIDGTFDALICAAGLLPGDRNAAELLRVNVLGLLAVARALMTKLAEGGSVVVTASQAGRDWPNQLDEIRGLLNISDPSKLDGFVVGYGIDADRSYNLSKEALIYWAKLQVEGLLPKSQRINTVSPSADVTDHLDGFLTAFGPSAQAALTRTGRTGKPEEIAAVITFLASQDSSWVNGQNIVVDGGLAAMMELDAVKR